MFGCSFSALLGWHGWWSVFGVALVFAIVAYLLTSHVNAKRRRADSDDSLSILKKRLAEGEITTDEFNTLKQYL